MAAEPSRLNFSRYLALPLRCVNILMVGSDSLASVVPLWHLEKIWSTACPLSPPAQSTGFYSSSVQLCKFQFSVKNTNS